MEKTRYWKESEEKLLNGREYFIVYKKRFNIISGDDGQVRDCIYSGFDREVAIGYYNKAISSHLEGIDPDIREFKVSCDDYNKKVTSILDSDKKSYWGTYYVFENNATAFFIKTIVEKSVKETLGKYQVK